jgi:integrase
MASGERVYNKTGNGVGRFIDSGLFETDTAAWIVAAMADEQIDFASRPNDAAQAFVTGLDMRASTVALVFQHLNSLLEAAVEDGLIARNPARGVKLPALLAGEVVPPTVEQVEAVYQAALPWFRPAVLLGVGLGLRQAEASGLTADRVQSLARSVRIDRQWNSRHRPAAFSPPKTRSSDRTVPASTYVLDRLAEHVGRRHEGFVLHQWER